MSTNRWKIFSFHLNQGINSHVKFVFLLYCWEEMANRFEIFLSNLKHITESNAKRGSPSTHLLGMNRLADWSPEELQKTYLHDIEMPKDHSTKLNDSSRLAPLYVDWRLNGTVTPVKDQGDCGKG